MIHVKSVVKLVSIATLALVATICLGDARSDCLKALHDAKKVGLPITLSDFNAPKPTQESKKIEAILTKADKVMRRNQEPLGPAIARDLDNYQRKQKGKPPIPYHQETPAEKAIREKDVLKVIAELVKTKGPRIGAPPSVGVGDIFSKGDSFVKGASVRQFLKLELASAEASVKSGNIPDSLLKYRLARRIVEVTRSGASPVTVFVENASIMVYFASIERSASASPSFKKAVSEDLVAPFTRLPISRVLQADFFEVVSTLDPKSWKLPRDNESIEFYTKMIRAYTILYPELKNCQTGQELESRYKKIAPRLGTYKSENEVNTYGPSWLENGKSLDKAEAKRLETIKVLGLNPR